MSAYADSLFLTNQKHAFISARDMLFLVCLAFCGFLLNNLSYSNTKSIIVQSLLMAVIFFLYKQRPVMLMVATVLLSVLPAMTYGGFTDTDFNNYYRLNGKICIAVAFIYLLFGVFVLKIRYKWHLINVLFGILMAFSMIWTTSMQSYVEEFWWMCVAYVVLPLFIRDDYDVRLILVSYVLAVDLFCLKVISFNSINSDVYRGTTNLDPNFAAFFVLIGMTIAIVIYIQYRQLLPLWVKLLLLSSLVISIMTMPVFASRTSFIMMGVLVLIYVFNNVRNIKALIAPVIGVVILTFLYLRGFFESIMVRFNQNDHDYVGGRFIIQSELLKSFDSFDLFHFLLGSGYLTAFRFGSNMQAHNSYISILIGFGLLGLLVYALYLVYLFISLRQSEYKSLLILFLILCLYGFSLEPYHMMECVVLFCVIGGINNIQSKSCHSPVAPDFFTVRNRRMKNRNASIIGNTSLPRNTLENRSLSSYRP